MVCHGSKTEFQFGNLILQKHPSHFNHEAELLGECKGRDDGSYTYHDAIGIRPPVV